MDKAELWAARADAHSVLSRVFAARAAASALGQPDAAHLGTEAEEVACRLILVCDELACRPSENAPSASVPPTET